MAKIFKFNDECSIIGEATATLKERFCMVVPGSYIAGLYRVLFRSNALMCKYYASKKYHNIGFSLKDENGEFKIGTILTYNAPEEDSDDNGNYVLSNTWYEKDMENIIDTSKKMHSSGKNTKKDMKAALRDERTELMKDSNVASRLGLGIKQADQARPETPDEEKAKAKTLPDKTVSTVDEEYINALFEEA